MKKKCIIGKVGGKSTLLNLGNPMEEKTSPDMNRFICFYYGSCFYFMKSSGFGTKHDMMVIFVCQWVLYT